MESNLSTYPIGIFDSGIGGLTIVKAINTLLPNENIIYFGDTKHTPWGDKSKDTIKNYSIKICDVLLKHNCKAIVIACNTASAVALDEIKTYVKDIPIINVIDPVVNFVSKEFDNKKIGLIGTKQTIASNAYPNKIHAKNQNIVINSLATPLLVPLIEEGMENNQATNLIIKEYLENKILNNIQALILGCTHYPIIKEQINDFYNEKIPVIDSTTLTAAFLQQTLKMQNLINTEHNKTKHAFYISDHNPHFVKLTKLFFHDDLELIHLSI